MASIQRLLDDLVMGIRKSTAKRSAMGLRRTPHTTARSQASRITLGLIGWEVETPVMSGVKDPRWFWAFREAPCATRNRDVIGLWNVDRACPSTWSDSLRPQIVAVVPHAACKSCWRRSHGIIGVPFAIAEPTKAS